MERNTSGKTVAFAVRVRDLFHIFPLEPLCILKSVLTYIFKLCCKASLHPLDKDVYSL